MMIMIKEKKTMITVMMADTIKRRKNRIKTLSRSLILLSYVCECEHIHMCGACM